MLWSRNGDHSSRLLGRKWATTLLCGQLRLSANHRLRGIRFSSAVSWPSSATLIGLDIDPDAQNADDVERLILCQRPALQLLGPYSNVFDVRASEIGAG